MVEIIKVLLVDIAVEEVKAVSPKVNPSRVSLVSGLHRKDVTRILRNQQVKEIDPGGVIARILSRWSTDKEFCTTRKKPRVLSTGDLDSEFSRLVLKESTDINPGTVLFELERIGAIERTAAGAKLINDAYSSPASMEDGWNMLAHDLSILVSAVTENLESPGQLVNLHLRTEYDNLYQTEEKAIRRWLAQEGAAFHKRAREFLATRDKDLNPRGESEAAGLKITLGSFSVVSGMSVDDRKTSKE